MVSRFEYTGSSRYVDIKGFRRKLVRPSHERLGCQVTVQTEGEAEAVRVRADPVALEQIVHNLLLNALQVLETQAPEVPRRVCLTVRRADGQGLLVIQDSGPGIAPELLPQIFLPFVSTREGGLGLGLSLSETLATGQGGSLSAANAPGGGARFTLALPLAAMTPNDAP